MPKATKCSVTLSNWSSIGFWGGGGANVHLIRAKIVARKGLRGGGGALRGVEVAKASCELDDGCSCKSFWFILPSSGKAINICCLLIMHWTHRKPFSLWYAHVCDPCLHVCKPMCVCVCVSECAWQGCGSSSSSGYCGKQLKEMLSMLG